VPKPADAHYFGHRDEARCVRAEPRPFDDGCGADLPQGLQPVRLAEEVDGKASAGPRWWAWSDLIAWRDDPAHAPDHAQLTANGWSPPDGDRRTHVAIDPDSLAADAGRLFQTEGLDLEADNAWLKAPGATGLQLLARFSEPLAAGLVHLGGERRLARLHPAPPSDWPQPPRPDWFSRMREAGGLTLTLLTPAIFEAGYRPGWLDDTLQGELPGAPGVRLQLVAAALERWQPHSGWDLAKQEARATRKLVGAGATYWFRLLNEPDEAALVPLWLTSLCDAEQDRRDGYGLALPAPWTPTV
jgi:CRISPR-associated protein Cmr3